MKRKLALVGLVLMTVGILIGCSKKEEAKPAVESFINAEFYLTDFDQYEKSFGKKIVNSDEGTITKQLTKQLAELGLEEADSKKAADAMFTALKEKTSYQVKVVSETQEKASIEVSITGLAMDKFEETLKELSVKKMIELVTEAGIENIEKEEDLNQLTSKADLEKAQKVVDAFHEDPQNINEIMIQAIEEMGPASQPKTVKLSLETNPKQKRYWQVKDEETVIEDISHILITPY